MMVANSTEDSSNTRRDSSLPPWAELVDKIKQNDTSGLEELYRVLSRGVRFYLCRQLGPQDLDDRVHDTFLTVAKAIQRGDLREPELLMGYVRTVVGCDGHDDCPGASARGRNKLAKRWTPSREYFAPGSTMKGSAIS